MQWLERIAVTKGQVSEFVPRKLELSFTTLVVVLRLARLHFSLFFGASRGNLLSVSNLFASSVLPVRSTLGSFDSGDRVLGYSKRKNLILEKRFLAGRGEKRGEHSEDKLASQA